MEQESFTLEGIDSEELIANFKRHFSPIYSYTNVNQTTRVFIFEAHYLRISSNLSATVILDFTSENNCEVNAIVSGGGHGLLELTWGAEKSMLKKIKKILTGNKPEI